IYKLFPRLEERKLNRGRQLSGGEQEMLSIGRALLLNPWLLILDEPSQGLAPLIVKEVFRIVAQMRAEGISVLLVEQNVRMSLEISDHAYVLENGQMVYSGPAAELRSDEARIQALAGASAEEWKLEDLLPVWQRGGDRVKQGKARGSAPRPRQRRSLCNPFIGVFGG